MYHFWNLLRSSEIADNDEIGTVELYQRGFLAFFSHPFNDRSFRISGNLFRDMEISTVKRFFPTSCFPKFKTTLIVIINRYTK